jgi:hypothetical protein
MKGYAYTNMRPLVAGLLTVLLTGCTWPDPMRHSGRAAETLKDLRASLDRVSSAPADKPFRESPQNASALVGLSRAEIRDHLGEPHVCDYPKLAPNEMMVAPCEHNGEWFYSFYKLPDNMLGGGPELLLHFGNDDLCTSAKWVFTQ